MATAQHSLKSQTASATCPNRPKPSQNVHDAGGLEQPDHFAVLVDVDVHIGRLGSKAWHGSHCSEEWIDEPSSNRSSHLSNGQTCIRSAHPSMRGHDSWKDGSSPCRSADIQIQPIQRHESALLPWLCIQHPCAVDLGGDCLNLRLNRLVQWVQEIKGSRFFARGHHGFGQLARPFASVGPMIRSNRCERSVLHRRLLDEFDLPRSVGMERVHGYDHRHTEFLGVRNMGVRLLRPARSNVRFSSVYAASSGRPGTTFGSAPVGLQGSNRGDQDHRIWN